MLAKIIPGTNATIDVEPCIRSQVDDGSDFEKDIDRNRREKIRQAHRNARTKLGVTREADAAPSAHIQRQFALCHRKQSKEMM